MRRLGNLEAQYHIVLLKVLLPGHLNFLELSEVGLCGPIACLEEAGSLFHGGRCLTNFRGCPIYVRLLLVFQTVLGVGEENSRRWLRLTEGH